MSNKNKLPNFGKLALIPVFALRSMVMGREPDADKRNHLQRASQAELLEIADNDAELSSDDIETQYEAYRYGRRLSLRLYLIPADTLIDTDAATITQRIADKFAAEARETDKGTQAHNRLFVVDSETFGHFLEIRYRYLYPLSYLDENEQPGIALETRYGFLWLDLADKYIVLLSRDDKLNQKIVRSLAATLHTLVHAASLPRTLVNKHFPLENARSVAYFDPNSQVRRAFSGKDKLYNHLQSEIQTEESGHLRLSGLFEEEISDDVTSGLGTTDRKGKIYFTRILSATQLRDWAIRRLPQLISDLREWQVSKPEAIPLPAEVSRLRITDDAKRQMAQILSSVLELKKSAESEIHFDEVLADASKAIGSQYLHVGFELECPECGEAAGGCAACGGTVIKIDNEEFICKKCKTAFVRGEAVSLRCIRDHVFDGALADAIVLRPTAAMDALVSRLFDRAGLEWRPGFDVFSISGRSIHRGVLTTNLGAGTTTVYISGGNQGAVGNAAIAQQFSQGDRAAQEA